VGTKQEIVIFLQIADCSHKKVSAYQARKKPRVAQVAGECCWIKS